MRGLYQSLFQSKGSRKNIFPFCAPRCAADLVRRIERNPRCSPSYIEYFAIEFEPKMRCRWDAKSGSYSCAKPKNGHTGRSYQDAQLKPPPHAAGNPAEEPAEAPFCPPAANPDTKRSVSVFPHDGHDISCVTAPIDCRR